MTSYGWRTATVVVEVRAAIAVALGLWICGCAANQELPTSLPPVSETQDRLPEPQPAESPVAAPSPPTLVVIEDSSAEPQAAPPQTLGEAAEAERARRATAQKSVLVLDNKSLAAHGKDQKLTVAEGQVPAADSGSGEAEPETEVDAEAYWRERGLEIRQRWRTAHDRIQQLEGEAETLRHQFYSTDDPYVRDGQVKPAWDRVLDDLDQSRRDSERGAQEVERFLEEGREAGALPGWLREGIELEPVPEKLRAPTAEPTEPVEANEPARDPR